MSEHITLGDGRAHVYVTRNATLEWIALTHQRFEEGRRELMLRLLSAEPVPGDSRRWTFRVGLPTLPEHAWRPELGPRIYSFVAYVVPDADLLVVGNVSLAQDAPRVHSSGLPSEADNCVKCNLRKAVSAENLCAVCWHQQA